MRGTPTKTPPYARIGRFIPAYAGNAVARRSSDRRVIGSSPRMRGTRYANRMDAVRHRFIPAYAGNAAEVFAPHPTQPVHPRVCGERVANAKLTKSASGSSPRMRGTPPNHTPNNILQRFIPAYAGNAGCDARGRRLRAVHPRVCGERGRYPSQAACLVGSSPRMRGTRRRAWGCARRCPVHPRVCGERNAGSKKFSQLYGSSPRMRGTPSRRSPRIAGSRFIPAYAGNAQARRRRRSSRAVHPRVCGERFWVTMMAWVLCGSSPRMRGTRSRRRSQRMRPRFIPAYAGNAPSCGAGAS